jgi:hypothetical protein
VLDCADSSMVKVGLPVLDAVEGRGSWLGNLWVSKPDRSALGSGATT